MFYMLEVQNSVSFSSKKIFVGEISKSYFTYKSLID